jgi:hypothetical protein
MSLRRRFLAIASLASVIAVSSALAGGQAQASPTTPVTGHFPIEEHIAVLEPESTACGFAVSLDFSGQGTFQAFSDEQGNLLGVHVLEYTSGTVSANGIALRYEGRDNRFYDLQTQTLTQVGLVFRYSLPGLGVVLMDRGRLIIENLGEGEVTFEAGSHSLYGDISSLCAALTP